MRLSPEYDGIELLYANDQHPDTLFSLKILAWARLANGDTVAMVPWLKEPVTAMALADPLNGRWEGYRLPGSDYLFVDAPQHKVQELDAALEFFGKPQPGEHQVQEIPDTIGTHAVFSSDGFHTISLMEVVSWRLFADGTLAAMVAEEQSVTQTPVLPGAECLEMAQQRPAFRYFFQHGIANRLKERDPEALAAVAMLAKS
ncbi:hypothetical protein A11A3_06086 [Alcanivorax hongdengensis A-11-3]|uniref:Uncharacterized protein n=1 Tax=Alcanivorax hongdengensis A-11-3 TaxID=1177179 RepID=L0WGQ6_9GAMM|nr:hypothetical protein [Alcanivorax hongdengensis]EKF75000.1 hypothetical protein A11A3_06086 [Alcanivorax hongdengensis A-11-3]